MMTTSTKERNGIIFSKISSENLFPSKMDESQFKPQTYNNKPSGIFFSHFSHITFIFFLGFIGLNIVNKHTDKVE